MKTWSRWSQRRASGTGDTVPCLEGVVCSACQILRSVLEVCPGQRELLNASTWLDRTSLTATRSYNQQVCCYSSVEVVVGC
jgi:hypothetical protein